MIIYYFTELRIGNQQMMVVYNVDGENEEDNIAIQKIDIDISQKPHDQFCYYNIQFYAYSIQYILSYYTLKNKLIIRFQNVNLNISILILTYSILTEFF